MNANENSAPSVRLLRGLADLTRRRRSVLIGIVLAGSVLLWGASGFYAVENGQSACVKRFGKVRGDAIGPGLQFRLPTPFETEHIFAGEEVFRFEIADLSGAKLQLISGDENLIATSLVVQYKVTDPPLYLFGCDAPAEIIAQVVRTTLLETVAEMEVDEILTTGKAQIQNRVRQTAQEQLRDYAIGVSLLSTTLQSVEPPTEAAISFRAVQDSRTESVKTISDAEMLREHVLSLTRAESNRMMEEAQAEAQSRVLEAGGAAERFQALLTQYRKSPEQTRLDLFQRQINHVLDRTEIVVLGPGTSPEIDFQLRSRERR